MKNLLSIILILLSFSSYAQEDKYSTEVTDKVVSALMKENYKTIYLNFDDTIKKIITIESLKEVFVQMDRRYGKPTTVVFDKAMPYKDLIIYHYLYTTKKAKLIMVLTVGKNEKVNGFRFLPAPTVTKYTEPTKYGLEARKVRDLSLKTPVGDLKGLLTLPGKGEKVPVAIFLHGSGPNDMDESLGNTKIFNDLSLGLADSGIASYRFHKRTKVFPGSFTDKSTLYDEVIQDALLAVELMKSQQGIDSNKIYIIGHSLGAMSAPLVAKLDPTIAGVVMLSSPFGKLHELLPKQIKYLKENTSQAITDEMVLEYEKSAKLIEAGNLSDSIPKSKMFNLSAGYWNYLNKYNHLEVSLSIPQPILLLNGSRDYQIDTTEFKGYEELFQDKENAKAVLLEGLNHLFIFGKGKSVPSEYNTPGNMDSKAINWIIKFIKTNEEY